MSDTLMAIIGIFMAVLLMLVLPLMMIADKNDELAQTVVQTVTSNFVKEIASQGKITYKDYDNLMQKIYATGNSYDVQIEVQIIDDNPSRTTTAITGENTSEKKYYSIYTNTILNEIEKIDGEYLLKRNDYIIVNIQNTNITIGSQLKNILYKFIGKDTYTIGASASATIVNNGISEI